MRRRIFNRRNFLRGAAGICVALPMLEATHGRIWAASGQAKRFIVFFSHGGTISCRHSSGSKGDPWAEGKWHSLDLWAPGDEGTTLDVLGEEMAPLEAFKSDLTLLRGVDDAAGMTQGDYGGHHGCSNATILTCADTTSGGDDAVALGPSIDQFLAQRLETDSPVPFPSIDLMLDGHNYGEPVYRASGENLSTEKDPQGAFDRLFADVTETSGEPTPEQLRIRAEKKSVLDGTLGHLAAMKKRVSASDVHLIDAHTEHVRSLEKRLEALENLASCTKPDVGGAPVSLGYGGYDGGGHELAGPILIDIMIHAFRCGLSNVGTFQIGDILTTWLPTPYSTDLGHSLGHAGLEVGPNGTESNMADAWRETIVQNRNWRIGLMARLLDGLKSTPEGDGNMLDNSVVLFTSEFGCGGGHSPRDLPCLLAGKAGGRWTGGRHHNYNKLAASDPTQSNYETDVSFHNVYTSIVQAFGYEDEHFGNDTSYKTGPLAELG
ncbi:MAG: DUF1552 domain-containing protein [Polyangiaceae bacterium]|nr:DUF1552 domain-containing protein [Polyangiaceae bacterium]